MKPDKLIAVVLALCVFGFHSMRAQSVPESSTNLRTVPQVYDPSQFLRTIPRAYTSSQRATNVRTIPRLGGCWRKTIRAQDVTKQIVIGPFKLGTWADEDYRICFGYDLHPQVSVDVTELQMRSSQSDIVRVDDSQVIFVNHLILGDHDGGTSSRHSFEIEQTTEFQGTAENGYLIVKAIAVGKRDWTSAYQTAWQATFFRE